MNKINDAVKNNPAVALTSVGATAFVLGFVAGYIYTSKKNSQDGYYEEDDSEDSDYDQLEFSFEEDALDDEYLNDVVVLNPVRDPSEIMVEPVVQTNIFHSDKTYDWDWDEEKLRRVNNDVYPLTKDEFFNMESDYVQSTLTYYAGDDILVDENEVPVYNHRAVVGELIFGYGSDDPNIVYVRNDRLKGEYEVIKDEGSYEIEVLGQHYEKTYKAADSKAGAVQKFRPE